MAACGAADTVSVTVTTGPSALVAAYVDGAWTRLPSNADTALDVSGRYAITTVCDDAGSIWVETWLLAPEPIMPPDPIIPPEPIMPPEPDIMPGPIMPPRPSVPPSSGASSTIVTSTANVIQRLRLFVLITRSFPCRPW